MRLRNTFLILIYVVAIILFTLYSYTQIDLGLTISSVGVIQNVQRKFQEIGFFQRSISVSIYIGLISTLFILYGRTVYLAYKKKLSSNIFWVIIGVISAIGLFAYPAFSYDFFNYLFTAKTVVIYHKNPYVVIPLEFTGVDTWLSFMHWTHLPSAYTPLWIISTLVPYVFGFGKLVFLLFNLKIYILLAYIATVYGIGLVLRNRGEHVALTGMAIFALNPLVIVECMISPHNDIVMMALAIWSAVLYQRAKAWASWLLLAVSIAFKLMTIFLIPAYIFKWNKKYALLGMLVGLTAVLFQREVLSWYWIWIIPFVALIPEYPSIVLISSGVSMGLLLRYAPFLYLGNWDAPVAMLKSWATSVPIVISVFVAICMIVRNRVAHLSHPKSS